MNGVAISGKAGSGKSALAAALVRELRERGHDAYRCAFGDALKDEVWKLYGVTKQHPDGRRILIQHGEARRVADPLHWVRLLAKQIDTRGGTPVIDDVRFTNELAWALGRGCLIVRLEAPDVLRELRISRAGGDTSIVRSGSVTETDLDRCVGDFDFFWRNCGQDLSDVAHQIAARLPALAALS